MLLLQPSIRWFKALRMACEPIAMNSTSSSKWVSKSKCLILFSTSSNCSTFPSSQLTLPSKLPWLQLTAETVTRPAFNDAMSNAEPNAELEEEFTGAGGGLETNVLLTPPPSPWLGKENED